MCQKIILGHSKMARAIDTSPFIEGGTQIEND